MLPTRIRHVLGTIIYDWPFFLTCMRGSSGWTRFRNRNERLTIDSATEGARCEWEFSSDLHLCNVFPSTGRWLLQRALAEWPVAFAERPATRGEPAVSFIIGHRGEARDLHLMRTLASIAGQKDVALECIVVEQSAKPRIGSQLPEWVGYIHTPIASDALPYNRSWAFNVGADAARASILVAHDNDLLVPAAYASEIVRRREMGSEFLNLKRFVFYLDQSQTAEILDNRFPLPASPERVVQNTLGGSIAAVRDAYFAIGAFDESFVGWGGEDNDFWDRAQTRRVDAFGYLPMIHLWHPPQFEKTAKESVGGRRRYLELSKEPAYERIERLRAGQWGQVDGRN